MPASPRFWSLVTMAVLLGASACGGGPPPETPRAAAPASSPPLPSTAPSDPREHEAKHKAAYARATTLAGEGRIALAISLLEPFAKEPQTKLPLAYWIHNELTWLRWGAGDLRGALGETNEGAKVLDRAAAADPTRTEEIEAMRLHALWDRAYLLLELGDPAADQARVDYETLAKAKNDHDGLAVLTAFFHARRREGAAAKEAAKQVDVENDSDLQDLYVIALALDAGGDAAAARSVRERVCKGHSYLMKPLILAQMAREGFRCAAP